MLLFERLRDYFQGIADGLAGQRSASTVFPNPTDAGISREDLLIEFLIGHLPKRCEAIKGGFIFDSEGNESRQVDLIITNDLTLQFKQFDKPGQLGKSFNCVEGCYCAISVKTRLDGQSLSDALSNLASIPPMPHVQGRLNPMLGGRDHFQDLPYKAIFAFDGIAPQTTLEHVEKFYADSPVPQNRRPDLIIVNNYCAIIHVGKQGGETRDGSKIAPYAFHVVQGFEVGAYSLMFLLAEIQAAANYGSQILMTFDQYLNKIPFR